MADAHPRYPDGSRHAPVRQYAFDRFRLAADASLLLDGHRQVPLAPKVLHTLRALLDRAGRVVSKDELMRAVWQDAIVEETGLTRNISLLRRALGDDGERWIVTVPRIGYRFAATVTVLSDAAPPVQEPIERFVGRREELRRLHEALRRCEHGQGTLIGLTGGPGMGKTTLATRFVREAAARALVGIGRSTERYGPIEPHLPVLEILESLTADVELARLLAQFAPTWSAHFRPQASVAMPAPPGTPERLLRELTHFLAHVTDQQPLVLLLDDTHWADTATTDVIAHLAPRLSTMRVLIVLAYRDRTYRQASPSFAAVRDELVAKHLLQEWSIPLLTREDVAEYVAGTATRDLPSDAREQVFARSEGNPLFMSALLAYLQQDDGTMAPAHASEVPDSLRGLIARMIGQLSAGQRSVLETAATQGTRFDTEIVARASGFDVLDVEDTLDEVERTHGLVARGAEAAADRESAPSWRFRHVLYQAGLVEALPPSRRVALAQCVADALLAHHDGDRAVAGQVALLLDVARNHAAAAEQFARASQQATAQLAFKDAYDLARRGERCLARATGLGADERARLQLVLTFAQLVPLSSWRGWGHPTADALVNQAAALAARLQDAHAESRALGVTSFVRLVRGECTEARDAARALAERATTADNRALLVNAQVQAQIACHHMGHFADADVHAADVMRIGPGLPPHERFMNVMDPCVGSLAESSRNAWMTGRLAQAASLAEQAVALAGEIGHADSLAFAWLFHAWLHGYRGDWLNCVRSANSGVAVADQAGTVQTLAWNRCVHGWARAHRGDVSGGRQELAAGMALSHSIMGRVALPQFSAMLVEVLVLEGNLDAARATLDEALAAGELHDDAYFSAELHRLAARCGADGPAGLTPQQYATRAIAIAREQGAAFLELRAALTAVELGGDLGLLRSALERLPEPEPWVDVQAARARLS